MASAPAPAAARRRYRGSSPAERRAERRERLLQAAIRVYGERGYRNATVKGVCDEAGLTERYFYESFENSEALLVACYEAIVDPLLANMAAAGERADGGPRDRLIALLAHYFDALRREPESARVFLVEVAGVSAALDRAFEESLERFGRVLAEAAAGGESAAPRRDALLRTGVVGGVLQIAISWIAGGYRRPLGEVTEAAATICMILAGESPPSGSA